MDPTYPICSSSCMRRNCSHGDHVLDLCSPDEAYRAQSIREMQRVIDLTRLLREHFPKPGAPPSSRMSAASHSTARFTRRTDRGQSGVPSPTVSTDWSAKALRSFPRRCLHTHGTLADSVSTTFLSKVLRLWALRAAECARVFRRLALQARLQSVEAFFKGIPWT